MRLENLQQAPHNCTMMGVMRGALDYYGLDFSDAFLYGAGGHAFVLNIHKALCPSGPYVWDREPVNALLAYLGLHTVPFGFFHPQSSASERTAVEGKLMEALDRGVPCYLLNMENQLITGYDDTGFFTAQPWPCADFPPDRLTFGSWAELGDEIHVDLNAIERVDPAPRGRAIEAGLRYAVSVWRAEPADDLDAYAMGARAYSVWGSAVRAGYGFEHGAWWNGVVWSECRARAADFFREIAPMLPSADEAVTNAEGYAEVSSLLERCSDRAMPADDKGTLLMEALDREGACVEGIERLLAAM